MKPERKREVIELVRRSPVTKKETLLELGLSPSTFYRWQRRSRSESEAGLIDRRPQPGTIWNQLRPEETEVILVAARAEPDKSPREIAFWISDCAGFSVSESSVYRVLKLHGLVREVDVVGFPAGPEYTVKTTRVNEQWQCDASYFFVVGWGWYYLISVLDDFSRYILAWQLKGDMKTESISEVVEQAIEWTGMKRVPERFRARMVTDNGPSYVAGAFEEYLRMHKMRHIRCSPHHPQTNGKLERFHETLKARVNLLVWSSPEELRGAIAEFIEFYNQRRYHEGIGNVAPGDVYYGWWEAILKRREEQKRQTLYERFEYNRAQRSQAPRRFAAPNTNNSSVAPSATVTTTTGEPDDSNRS
jgi:putative transposase